MIKFAGVLVAFLLIAFMATPLVAQDEETQTIALEKILGNPQPFEGLTVTLALQFHQLGRLDGPVFTKFEKDWYQNFSAWPDASNLWEKKDYINAYQYFFIFRHSEGASQIIHAPPYSRWLVTAQVSEIFNGKPWFEVKGLRKLDKSVNLGTLKNLVAGFRAAGKEQWQVAASAFRAADAKSLPTDIRLMAMNQEAAALHAAGRTVEACDRLEVALKMVDGDPGTQEALTTYRGMIALDAEGNRIAVASSTSGDVSEPKGKEDKVGKVTLDLVPKTKKPAKVKAGDVSNDN